MNWRPWRLFRRTPRSSPTHDAPATKWPSKAFNLDDPLVWFSKSDPWTIRDAAAGTVILGSVGSGKTSGSGATLARSFLRAGMGGLVLTAKVDEYENWHNYCKQTGRLDSIIHVTADGPYRFNPLDYELNRAGSGAGLTENIVNLLMTLAKIGDTGSSQEGGGKNQQFWDKALQQLLRNSIDLLSIAKGTISIPDLYQLVISAAISPEQLESDAWCSESFWHQCIAEAEAKANNGNLSEGQVRDLNTTLTYWYSEYPTLAEETRSSIVVTFSSLADAFMRGVLADLFCSETTIVPELSHNGSIIIVDLPIHEYKRIGLLAQVLVKYMWQQSTQRRAVTEDTRPCFNWMDEAQLFLNQHDQTFLTTSRSARACSVLISQNISNFHVVLGEGRGRATADALLALLSTKIVHASNDPTTNQWMADLIARAWQNKTSVGSNITQDGSRMRNTQTSEVFEYQVAPHEFTTLKTGGELNQRRVEAIIAQAGRIWNASGTSYLRATFKQQ